MAAYNTFVTKLEGIEKVIAAANALERRIQRGGMRAALNKATTPMLRKARALAPKESGALKRSLKKKVSTNKRQDAVTVVIGADKKTTVVYQGKVRKPSRYLHLVEMGHGSVPPQPFLRPAYESTRKETTAIYSAELKKAIEKRTAQLTR